jgi:hypothetical protein
MNRSELSDILKASYMPQKQAAEYLKESHGHHLLHQLKKKKKKKLTNYTVKQNQKKKKLSQNHTSHERRH